MRAVLLDGAKERENTFELIHHILVQEVRSRDFQLVTFRLRTLEIAPCQGCFGCWTRTPGKCLVDDTSQEIARQLAESDLLVLLTSVTFGGYSSELKKALDRQICLISPFFSKIEGETHHRRRYPSSPRLIAIGPERSGFWHWSIADFRNLPTHGRLLRSVVASLTKSDLNGQAGWVWEVAKHSRADL